MKYKITNLTGMKLRYNEFRFEPNETKILDLEKEPKHEYFKVEKLDTQKSLKGRKEIKLREEK